MPNAAILLAAGRSARMRGTTDDKVLASLAGIPAFCYSVNAFLLSKCTEQLVIVYRDDSQKSALSEALAQSHPAGLEILWVQGGAERQDSVFNALSELSLLVDYVFIHDCARPLIRPEDILRLNHAVMMDKAAVLAHRVTDTIKRARNGTPRREHRRRELKDLPRSELWAMETPQAFERELISEAYRRLRFDNKRVTDDTAAVSRLGTPVTIVENSFPNPKLTVPSDLAYIEYLLSRAAVEA